MYLYVREPSSGGLWWINGCVPPGWSAEDLSDLERCDHDGSQPPNPCFGLDESSCLENQEQCMSLVGQRITESGQCAEEMEFAACTILGHVCVGTFVYARDPASGQLWGFNGCSPAKWTNEETGYLKEGCRYN